jgi:hypothetical protein
MRLPIFIGIRIFENERERPEKEVSCSDFYLVRQGNGMINPAKETTDFANNHNQSLLYADSLSQGGP